MRRVSGPGRQVPPLEAWIMRDSIPGFVAVENIRRFECQISSAISQQERNFLLELLSEEHLKLKSAQISSSQRLSATRSMRLEVMRRIVDAS